VADESPDPLLGRELDGRYRLQARLGEGGLGVVYRARHLRLDRDFAIKVLQPEYAQNEGLRARFEREAKALGALTHPGVVGVTDFGIDGLSPFLVMELLEGATLDVCMPLPDARALAILRDVLGAVAFAHGLGLVHRDLKPANVFLQALPEGEERVRVLDFGLAKFLDQSEGAALTKPGATLGTPAYMSPEQALGGAASPRNDVYALGILLFELLAHERPFRGVGGDLMRQHLLVPVPSLGEKRPDLPALAAIDAIVQRACAKAPAERFADAAEMRTALDHALGRSSGAYATSSVARSGEQRMMTPPPVASPAITTPHGKPPEELATRAPIRAAKIDVVAQTVLADSGVTSNAGNLAGPVATLALNSGVASPATTNAAHPAMTTSAASATIEERPPSPRMPASRPVMKAPVVAPPKRSSGSIGIVLVLGGVMLVALAAFALLMPQVFGEAYDPIAWITGSLGTTTEIGPAGPLEVSPGVPDGPDPIAPVAEPDAGTAPGAIEAIASDPWEGRVPAELRRHRARVASGENLSDSARSSLRVFMRDHPGDPRPQLLMGHADVNRRAFTDALEHYSRAMDTNPGARFDPAMLENIVRLSANRTVGERARGMVTDLYGADALPTLRRVRVDTEDSEEIERLDQLEESLLGS
jgi:serine/threonine-protein kinase